MEAKNNMIETVKELNSVGYTEDFRLTGEKLHWVAKNVDYNADQFEVDYAYRFESSDTPEDTSMVYAVSIPKKGTKGVLLDVLDNFSSLPDNFVNNKVREKVPTVLTHDESNNELKFGFVPKVHKSKFNENPHRYELRKNFPDFPACPFGQSFSMLGYDKEVEQYVWLVTSIIRDERLQVNDYKNPE
ncbi:MULTISPECIES: hypothetical protein [Flavobacteriaceae]|jgi:hypothetical protein|uniref:Uncharacterized protein n=1 Tax=Maribacter flavus TaxID=1658664 RepID=A0A5B2TRU6_9FLAO|nr:MULTISPECIES: hypothetical protein [Flavobacteriaceae]KAA2217391.1 hypothetical protein F0361_15705 [Maribacter flavus]NYJ28089.1 hypothetical protein [Muricauda sp. ARW1Y1]